MFNFTRLFRGLGQKKSAQRTLARKQPHRLFLERLEDRAVPAITAVTSDLWDVSQGSAVTADSGVLDYGFVPFISDIRNMFGNVQPPPFGEQGHTLFRDFQPTGTLHWVEWQTPSAINLQSFNLIALHDGAPRDARARGFSRFTLYAHDGSAFTPLFEILPSFFYGDTPAPANSVIETNAGKNLLALSANVTPTTAQRFRAEFVQYGNAFGGNAAGPRIVELDGFDTPSPFVVTSNTPPSADAGGPYSVLEGGSVTLDGAGSSDPDEPAAGLTYEWDLDYDGVTFNVDASGAQPAVSFPDDFATRTIGLRVTDAGGLSDIATTTLEVANVAPAASIAGPADGLKGETLTFTLGAADPSPADQAAGFDFAIDWNGDGIVDQTVSGPSGMSVDHVFDAAGQTTVVVTAADKDGGVSAPAGHVVNVIQPLSFDVGPQQVNLNGNGVLPIALLSSADFNVTALDLPTLRLSGAAAVHHAFQDVDGDGDLDLVLHFRRQDFIDEYAAALAADLADGTLDDNHQQVALALTGKTLDGADVLGVATIDFFMTGKKLEELLATL